MTPSMVYVTSRNFGALDFGSFGVVLQINTCVDCGRWLPRKYFFPKHFQSTPVI